jgi:long-chain acyl-CoA synthetase
MDVDGFVTINDRKRDVVMVSGFSVFPTEIEDVLAEHPAVESCAVAGVSHSYRGETVKAFVVLHDGTRTSEEELRRFCAVRLVDYKVPTSIEFRADLPRNMLGKVLRRVLRDEHERLRAGANLTVRPAPAPAPPPAPSPAPPPAPAPAPSPAPPSPGPATTGTAFVAELERLARLRESGALTDSEFQAAKARLLQH